MFSLHLRYLTTTEWRNEFGGYKGKKIQNQEFRRLPFSCCTYVYFITTFYK